MLSARGRGWRGEARRRRALRRRSTTATHGKATCVSGGDGGPVCVCVCAWAWRGVAWCGRVNTGTQYAARCT